MNNSKVSILVPVYGVERYIERCAVSIFEQSYNDLDIIFVDDHTPDKSIDILYQVLKRYPQRAAQTKIIKHELNKGLAAARNTAIENSSGDFLIWVDSDDYIDEFLVEKCVTKQREKKCDIVLFDFQAIFKHKKETIRHLRCNSSYERTLKLLSRQTPVCVWGGFYNMRLYKENGIVAVEGVNNNEDYQVTPRLSYYSRSIAYLDMPLYFYNCTNTESITKNFSKNQAEQGWRSINILRQFFNERGDEYLEALQSAELFRLATYLKSCVEYDNRDYYKELRLMQKKLYNCKIDTVPISYRIYLYVKSFYILNIYTKIGIFLKKIKL